MEPSEPVAKPPKPKRPLEILRERRGGMSKELKEYFNAQQRVKKAVRAALASGPKTVPQIASEAGTRPSDILWHVMAMRRYGEIVDGAEQDGYVLYRLNPGAQVK